MISVMPTNRNYTISVVVPFYNERESVRELHQRLLEALRSRGQSFELIFVDDGSRDGTYDEIRNLRPVRGFRFGRNLGQTAALGCGVAHAKGEVIITMDGDLENRPEDIPLLLTKLDEGYDVVAGWRKNRWSLQFILRKLPSLAANRLISWMTGMRLHDHGCNLRAYRAHVFRGIVFSGEMHRMLAAYLGMHGAKVAEIPVSYAPRKFGKSKYGLSRTFKVLLDVLWFYFSREYASRPLHFFGYTGFISIGLGLLAFLLMLYLRISQYAHFNQTPLPEFIALLMVVGFQFILMGLLAELLIRSRQNPDSNYEIVEKIEQ